jgi:hypothetical protein
MFTFVFSPKYMGQTLWALLRKSESTSNGKECLDEPTHLWWPTRTPLRQSCSSQSMRLQEACIRRVRLREQVLESRGFLCAAENNGEDVVILHRADLRVLVKTRSGLFDVGTDSDKDVFRSPYKPEERLLLERFLPLVMKRDGKDC